MLSFQIDDTKAEEIYREMVAKKIEEIHSEKIFWKRKELVEYSNMSWSTIREKILYDDNFPKFKTDRDWRFPVKECKAYLENWWKTQERS